MLCLAEEVWKFLFLLWLYTITKRTEHWHRCKDAGTPTMHMSCAGTGTGVPLAFADLTGQDFRGKKLYKADLRGTNFTRADMEGASLFGAFAKDAKFTGAKLGNADLESVDFENADLSDAVLEGAQVSVCLPMWCFHGAPANNHSVAVLDM